MVVVVAQGFVKVWILMVGVVVQGSGLVAVGFLVGFLVQGVVDLEEVEVV